MRFRFAASIVILAVLAFSTHVQAKRVQCPQPYWDDQSVLFTPRETLFADFQTLADVLTDQAVGDEVKVTRSVTTVQQQKALNLAVHFPGTGGMQQVLIHVTPNARPQLTDLSQGIGMWIKADPFTYVSMKFVDEDGRFFQIPIHCQKQDTWEYLGTTLNTFRQFEDKGSIQPSFPVQWVGMVIHDGNRGFARDFSVSMRGFEKVSRPLVPTVQQLHVYLDQAPLGHVYLPGQMVRATFDTPRPNGLIQWQLLDYHDHVIEKGQSRNHVKFQYKSKEAGFYRLIIKLTENEQRVDTRELSFAIQQPIAKAHARIGLCSHLGRHYFNPDGFELYPLVGVGYLRNGAPWHHVERTKGVMKANHYREAFYDLAHQKTLKGMTIFNGKARHYGNGVPQTPQEIDMFVEYCKYIASRMDGVYTKFEIWNEWTNGTGMGKGFKPTPENYTTLLKAIMPKLREAIPNREFVGLGGENPYRFGDEIKAMLEAGAGKYVDSISVHPYRQPFPPEIAHRQGTEPVDQTMLNLLSQSKQFGGPDRIQITEIGYPTFRLSWGVNDKQQAQYIVRTLAMLHSVPQVDQVYWYSLRDEDELPLPPTRPDSLDYSQHHFGIFRAESYNYAPKPAVAALATYVRQTVDATFSPVKRLDNGIHRVDIKNADGKLRCVLLWTVDQSVDVNITGKNLSITDIVGTQSKLKGTTLTVTPDMQYLSGDTLTIEP
ncbi:MAG: hypothetical protein ACF8OB_04820 [Phycisphaeraceae bacterium JB051]